MEEQRIGLNHFLFVVFVVIVALLKGTVPLVTGGVSIIITPQHNQRSRR